MYRLEALQAGTRTQVKTTRRSFYRFSIAGCAALLYAVVLIVSSSCALVHGDLNHGQHQHHGDQGSSTQNNICAWACQATADAVAAVGPPSTAGNLAIGPGEFSSAGIVLSTYSSSIQSRAPPSPLFVSLG